MAELCPALVEAGLPALLAYPIENRVVLWLDAELGFADGTWCDRSGNGHHATPIATPPSLVDDEYPAVRFGEGMTLSLPGPFNDFAQGMSWALVQRPGPHPVYGGHWALRLGQSFNPYAPPQSEPYDLINIGSLQLDDFNFSICDPSIGSCRQAWADTWFEEGVWTRTVVVVDGMVRVWVDGVEMEIAMGPAEAWPPPWDSPRMLGAVGAEVYRGDIAEVIVFGKALTEAEVSTLDAYWTDKRITP
jgi:hypothetical protein